MWVCLGFFNPYFGHDIMNESLLVFLVFIVKYGNCEIMQGCTISFIADRTINRTFKSSSEPKVQFSLECLTLYV